MRISTGTLTSACCLSKWNATPSRNFWVIQSRRTDVRLNDCRTHRDNGPVSGIQPATRRRYSDGMATSDATPPEPRRFSIRLPHQRWILLATVILIIAYGVLSIWIPYYREQQIVQKIEGWGGRVQRTKGGPYWLRRLVGNERMDV